MVVEISPSGVARASVRAWWAVGFESRRNRTSSDRKWLITPGRRATPTPDPTSPTIVKACVASCTIRGAKPAVRRASARNSWPAGFAALLALCDTADVFVHNIRPQKLERLGLSPAVLRARNPRLVYAGLLGFGSGGPYAGSPAYDDIIQALSGAADLMRRQCGEVAVFAGIDPGRTALLVIDLQNAFLAEGQPGELPMARAIIGNVNRLAGALRAAGGKVFWVRHTSDSAAGQPWPRFHEFARAGWGEALCDALIPGTPGHQLHDGLDDEVVDKTRFSALIQGSSDLDGRLRAQQIDTVIVTGTITNVCCESTARDAMMLNYRVFFVSDANAGRSDAEHNATLSNMMLWFADVRSTEALLDLIARPYPAATEPGTT